MSTSATDSTTEGEEKTPPTYDDKLAAEIYKDKSSQNKTAIWAMLALAGMGVSYGKEVRDAYYILKNPLDPKKLVEDLDYKKKVERAIQLVKRHEGKKLETGKSKLTKEVADSRLAISRVNLAYDQQHTIKSSLRFQYGVDLRTTYGFDEEQIKKIYDGALQRVKDRPNLSMQEAVRIEARVAGLGKVKEEVESDTSIKKRDRKKEIGRRLETLELETKDKQFTEKTARIYELEKEQCKKMQESAVASTSNILGIKPQPQAAQQPAPTAVKPPPVFKPQRGPLTFKQRVTNAVLSITTAASLHGGMPPKQPEQTPIQPTPITWQSPTMRGPTLRIPSIPRPQAVPKVLTTKIPGLSKLSSFGNFLGKASSLGNILGSFSKKILAPMLQKGLNLGIKIAGKLGSKALGQLAATVLPGIGNAVMAIAQLTGLDKKLTNFAKNAAIFSVVAVVGVFLVVLACALIGLNLTSGNTPDNPIVLKTVALHENNLSWEEFEKEYLSLNDQPANQVSKNIWEQFTNDYLVPQQTQLSLEQNIPTD